VLERASIIEDLGLDQKDNQVYKAGNPLKRRELL
jgi:hypothetical protein